MKIMKKPGDWCGEDILEGVDNPIKAFLTMKHRWKAEVDLDDCDLCQCLSPKIQTQDIPHRGLVPLSPFKPSGFPTKPARS
jgi:hypothetical protein